MSKSHYVFSTLTADQRYTGWITGESGQQSETGGVFVKGGTGIANDRFITPLGVMTEVTDEELTMLEANEVFKLHKANGYIVVQPKSADAEKVAADMKLRDGSSPKTSADFENTPDGIAKPTEGKKKN